VVANDAQENMVGLTKEQVLGCMGPPAAKAAEGATEVWSYASGNGQVTTVGMSQANGIASGGPGYATGSATGFGVGTTTRRFCTVNVTMTAGRVSRINYVGPTGGLLTPASNAPSRCRTARTKGE
jgi:outer membrane protein assembly factor BamE (lipoprotein component of BamABCDE complex)